MKNPDFDISRRRLFQMVGIGAVGVAGAGTLASCSRADDSLPEGDRGSFHGAYPYETPPDGHYNMAGAPYAPVPRFTLEGPYRDLIVLPSAYYYWHDKKWEYMLAESSELDAEALTFTVKIRDGLTWSDGEPLTSKDYMTSHWLQWIQRAASWSSISEIEAPDDTTFVASLSSPSAVIERYILRGNVIASHAADESGKTYGDFADEAAALFADGKNMDSDEGKTLGTALQEFRPVDLIVSGPFTIDPERITDTEMTLIRNDKGFNADVVKFDRIVVYNGETPSVDPLVQDGSIDYATHAFTPSQEKAYQEMGMKILRPPNYSGPCIFINFAELDEFNDVRARRALAHAINRADNGAVALGDSGVAVEYMVGFSDIMVPDWLSADALGKLDKYEYDQDKAASLLEEAGWTKDGDTWMTPDGKAAEYTIKYPGDFADWAASGDNAAEQLTAFGIKLTPNPIDFEQYTQEVDLGEFQFAINLWGSSQHPHPHFAFVTDLFLHNTPIAQNIGGDGIAFDLNVETEAYGKLDLEEVVNAAGQGLDEAEQKENVTKAAVAFNELLPILPMFERYGNNPTQEGDGKRVKAFPDENDPILENAVYADNSIIMLMITGQLEPGA
ncbi:peptide/nickel transport system substrate-binding protein [Stackebrandtia endophytica]|uniref:Peptide/nickel transport system substrate-binding protein n=1 Tax=Stackebrandtia endophytica TaxID=1496996 RepID=A0A543AU60_9ACTN|nr:ABC transporter substrate-binding protein [Stackebrandtia endophytica]TQL76089.1 peptide/nickel transport system substrate-binding protein [Stackebrandtia endophytica]